MDSHFGWARREMFRSGAVLAALTAASALSFSQFQAPIRSPEVHADKRVTFRFRAPNAKEVFVSREGAEKVAMSKGDDGVWTVTTDPMEPDLYGYSFQADGVSLIDPGNPLMKRNLLNTTSMVHVPSDKALPWEEQAVPRGALHHHFYDSGIAQDRRDFFVYTPPGYNPSGNTRYPVLYLLHGYSDDASGWSAVGRAHVILDNLIAQKKAKPMLVVMPLGYGTMEVISNPREAFRNPDMFQKNFGRFRDALLKEVIPQVERSYHVRASKDARAIAGLSMGGAETLYTALNAPEMFSYGGAFSSGGLRDDLGAMFPKVNESLNKELKLIWIACGVDDRLIEANRKFTAFLKERGVKHEALETPGAHTWMVWRRNLAEFAPKLF